MFVYTSHRLMFLAVFEADASFDYKFSQLLHSLIKNVGAQNVIQ